MATTFSFFIYGTRRVAPSIPARSYNSTFQSPAWDPKTKSANVQKETSMNTQIRPPRIGPQPWDVVRPKLDLTLPFANMRDTPYYRDCVWEQFSKAEYERRYKALRAKMREDKLDAVIV